MPFEWLLGWRYTRAGRATRRNGFISFISGVSVLGIALGVAALIIVLSVMNGFQKEVRDRMLSVIAHVELMDTSGIGLQDWQALGWPATDGLLPWAAQAARQRWPQAPADQAWAWVHLCHWHVRNGQVTMLPTGAVSPQASDALLDAMRGYFAEDGITLHAWQPGLWLAQGEVFRQLPTAAMDRVLGRQIAPWLVGASLSEHTPAVKLVRRLQNEMQMLLYQHPVNAARSLPLNSFWVSGSGALPATTESTGPQPAPFLIDSLTAPALSGDVDGWLQTWRALDADVLPQRLQAPDAQLLLCGDTQARCWQAAPPRWRTRLQRWLTPVTLRSVLS